MKMLIMFLHQAEVEQLSQTHLVQSLTKTIRRPSELITMGISLKQLSLAGISCCSKETMQANVSQDNDI